MPKKGKKGADQRVKGNVKTASSGRMSELLGSDAMGFIGFDSVSSGLHGNSADSIDGGGKIEDLLVGGSGSAFQVVMKQLGKRDPTTKLKALQEFSVLCGQEETHEILAVLYVWALMYNKLSMDNDHRVREGSHKALRACAEKLKSGLAPQLRSIIGCWLSGMCDPHGPAATAAKLAFDAAFTSKKQREVLEFGFKSVFKHAEEMALTETPDTFSDPKVVPADERQQRYERALVMAVHSLSLILRQVSPDHLSKSSEVYQALLLEKRVWKLARHGNPYVRAAVFSLVTALCERTPEFVGENMKVLCSAVLSSLGEDDPVVIGPLWEACLTLITKTENWSEHVNVRKGLLPGLWSFLKSGGHGSAKITYPCILPLLSILIDKVFSEDFDFAKLFLERLGSGLHGDRVRVSRVESEVVMKTYCECVMFLVLKFTPTQESANLTEVFKLIKELLVFSLSKACPPAQCEVVSASFTRLLTSLLLAQDRNPALPHCLEEFREELEQTLSDCVLETAEHKSVVGRLESLLSTFHSPSKAKKIKGSSVRFSDQPTEGVDGDVTTDHVTSPIQLISDHISSFSSHVTSDEESHTLRRDYIRPVVCTLCARCVARLSGRVDQEISRLLLTLVRLYCADSAFSLSLLSSLRSSHPDLLSKYVEGVSQDAVAMPTLLSKLARLDVLSTKSSKFTSDMLECMLVLVTRSAGIRDGLEWVQLLTNTARSHPPVFPLLLMKLVELGEGDSAIHLLNPCAPLLTGLVTVSGEERDTVYLWPFLQTIFSAQTETPLGDREFINSVLILVSQQLCEAVSSGRKLSDSGVNMLKVLGTVQKSIIESQEDECVRLLECLLRWTLFGLSTAALEEPGLLETVIQCYQHLSSLLPHTTTYLSSCSRLVSMEIVNNHKDQSVSSLLTRNLQSGLLYSALHSHVMSHDSFCALYSSLTKLPKHIETTLLPLSSLDQFCQRNLLFSPLHTDLNSSALTDTLPHTLTPHTLHTPRTPPPHTLTPLFYLAVLLTNSPLSDKDSETDSDWFRLVQLQQRLGGGSGVKSVFGGESGMCEGVREWVEAVLSLLLAATCLIESDLTRRTVLETRVCELFQTAAEECVTYACDHAPHWLTQLVQALVERASMEGSLWLPVLRNTFDILGRLSDTHSTISLRDLTSILYRESEGPIVYAALKPLNSDCYQQQIEELATQRASDPCLLVGCLKLLPTSETLICLGSKVICEISEKQANSELTLFESLSESAGDPLSHSTLSLFSLLLSCGRGLPPSCMDFVLCSIVSLVELLSESPPCPTVNHTVFSCLLLDTVQQLSLHFSSPGASGEQTREWAEFFQPSLQAHLLSLFLRQTASPSDPSLAYQTLSLSRAVSVVCSSPEGANLEQCVDILLSGHTHSCQVAGFKLAERIMESQTVVLDDDVESSKSGNVLKLSYLKDLFSKCFDKVNIDLVFLEDTQTQRSKVAGTQTTAYLLTWLLVIRVMSRCGAESRGSLSEWLKELSLFDHLLHGLVSLLPHSLRRATQPTLTVTLSPNLQQLALVTYTAVARQLPCMLRQWYLTLNRQTSAEVSFFTTKHVSPLLQNAELASIRQAPPTHGNMEVRVYSNVSEVSVVYRVDEFSIELFVRLPESYPLQPPLIREGKRVRVDQAQWRKWLLQLNIFVTNQNGSLMDGLLLWKSNLDKHFSGVEDCMICFSVIHSSNYSLPRMICKTCKKKFHSACLYKWFNTSNKSSCPLCRNIF